MLYLQIQGSERPCSELSDAFQESPDGLLRITNMQGSELRLRALGLKVQAQPVEFTVSMLVHDRCKWPGPGAGNSAGWEIRIATLHTAALQDRSSPDVPRDSIFP